MTFRPMASTTAILVLLALLAAWGMPVPVGAADEQRPNIVFLLADDMGYGDVQALNPDSEIPTPHLDSLAADGMTFTDAHTPSAVCTPTRYGLLTGRYCWRTRLKRGVLNGYSEPLIQRERITVAEFLQDRGYRTGIVGKWHLGLGWVQGDDGEIDFSQPLTDGPHTHGFEFSHIIPASLDFPPYVYIENGEVTAVPESRQPAQPFPAFLREGEIAPDLSMEDVLDHLGQQAADYIARSAEGERPFFLYFPLTAPHKPVLPHPRFRGETDLGPYGDFIVQVDATVGMVLEALDAAGEREHTLVIYTSDNGSFMFRLDDPEASDHTDDETIQAYRSDSHTANGIFRGTKADIWEGGHHVPFLARWPAEVAPGSEAAETICLTDFFATAADLVNADLPDEAAPDSFSLLPLLRGGTWSTPRAPVIHHSAAGMFAIRDGRWKLVLGNGSGGRETPRGSPFERPYALFDLSADPAEKYDLIDRHPQVARDLEQRCLEIRDAGRSR